MAIKIGINGFGRICRVALRIAMKEPDIYDVVAINYRNVDLDYMVYMIKYDTVFGRYPGIVDKYEDGIIIDGKKIRIFDEANAADIKWSEAGAEYIIEGTGAYVTTEKALGHLNGGAKKVIITAPAKDKETPTFVMGVNNDKYTKDIKVISNASCTTNCLAPLAKVLQDNFGIKQGLMSTIHAATAKQKVVDSRSMNDWRLGRAVFGNIIPSSTGAAKAVALVIPELQGKMTGISYRIPTGDVSVIDLNVELETPTTYEDICAKIKEASETYMSGILGYTEDEVVSADFIGDPHTSIFDATQGTMLGDRFVKLISWYDNEYGYSKKTLEMAAYMYSVDNA
jgi:glyceraldehyde 3-phosphate dehydrogenase